MKQLFARQFSSRWRNLVQWLFFGWCIFLGVQFGLFVSQFNPDWQGPYYPRPPGVEAFLPIGALVSLKAWLTTGYLDPVHPAAMVLLVTFFALALLARKSFCSFLCPVGTVSEGAWKLGRRLFGRNLRIWRWLDLPLQGAKYLLLLFFLKLIVADMPVAALQGFLNSPYWAIADVRMLNFFLEMSHTALVTIVVLVVLSLPFRNFWCRYLCPYGALLGLFSLFSPARIRRNRHYCIDCGACSRACPALIDVQHKGQVLSPECTGCLTCVSVCPSEGALQMTWWRLPLPGWTFIVTVLALFTAGVLTGMISGHWDTSLTHEQYQQLVPLADRVGF